MQLQAFEHSDYQALYYDDQELLQPVRKVNHGLTVYADAYFQKLVLLYRKNISKIR